MYPIYPLRKNVSINNLGFITDNRVIVYKGTETNIIYLKNIRKIDLIKKRKLKFNLIFLFIETLLGCFLIYNIEMGFITKFIIVLFFTIVMLISIFYKFYFYKIIVYLNDNKSLTIEVSQWKKAQAKELYFSIKRKITKKE